LGAFDTSLFRLLYHRHDRRLEGMRRLYPTDTSAPTAARVFAPFISDIIQPVQILPNIIAIEIPPVPSAGAEWAFDVPGGQIWKIQSLSFVFTTDVNVANRRVTLVFEHQAGGNIFFRTPNQNIQTASNALRYSAGPGLDVSGAGGGTELLSLPAGFTIPQTSRIRSVTDSIQATDAFTQIVILLTRTPEPRVGG